MKTILVRGPRKDEEVISSFPLLHYIHDEYSSSKIIVVLNEGQKNLYNFLPFQVEVYYLPHNRTSLMGIHHFAVNTVEIFNVDMFIDLENTLKSAFLGFSFKAKSRLGYKGGLNSIFLTHKLEGKKMAQMLDADEQYLNLFSFYKNISLNDYLAKPHIEGNLGPKDEREILVILGNANDYKNELVRMLPEFEERIFNISLLNRDDKLKESDLIKTLSSIETTNKFKLKEFDTYQNLLTGIFEAAFIFTDVDWICYIAAYLGRDSFLLSRENRSMPKFKHFSSSPIRVSFQENEILLNLERENQHIGDLKGLIEFIHKFLEI